MIKTTYTTTTTITSYGNTKQKQPDCILLCLHGDDGKDFLENYPIIKDVCEDELEILKKYITIEQDFGSKEISHTIASFFSKQTNDEFRTDIISVNIPRGILDIGRTTARKGLRNVFDQNKHVLLTKKLHKLHHIAFKEVNKLFAQLKPNGIWIDIHTMAPFNPKIQDMQLESTADPLSPFPGSLHIYNNEYTNPTKFGQRRSINIATKTTGNKFVANKKLVKQSCACFKRANIQHHLDHPHPMNDNITASSLMQKFGRGLFIDVPKDYFSKGTPEQVGATLHNLEIDQNKLENISNPISLTIQQHLLEQKATKINTSFILKPQVNFEV